MNDAQWDKITGWAEKLTRDRTEFTNLVVAERARGNLDHTKARILLSRAGFSSDQIDGIL